MRSALEQSFWDRLIGVVTLQRPVYDAIRRDPEATSQGWLIVLLIGLGNGIAIVVAGDTALPPDLATAAPDLAVFFDFDTPDTKIAAIAVSVVGAVLFWFLWSWALLVIGNLLTPKARRATGGEEMRRLVAWSDAPALAQFLSVIPAIGPLVATLGSLWSIVAMVMAVRVAFEAGIGKAIAIVIAALLASVFVLFAIVMIAVVLAAGAA